RALKRCRPGRANYTSLAPASYPRGRTDFTTVRRAPSVSRTVTPSATPIWRSGIATAPGSPIDRALGANQKADRQPKGMLLAKVRDGPGGAQRMGQGVQCERIADRGEQLTSNSSRRYS